MTPTYLYVASVAITKDNANTVISFPVIGHADEFESLFAFANYVTTIFQVREDFTVANFLANLTYICLEENGKVRILRDLVLTINNMHSTAVSVKQEIQV